MSGGLYWLGMVEAVAFGAAVLFSAYRLRRRVLPGWRGSVARLAEAVLALSLVVVVSQLLGLFGLFRELPLLVAAAALAFWCARLGGDGHDQPDRAATLVSQFPSRRAAAMIAVGVGLFVVLAWLPATARMLDEGIWGFDSMWYHLPEAARFAQTGSLTSLHHYGPVETHWFFPANSELLHAIGISLVDRDILSPLTSLGWVALSLLAAWCVGRPYGVAAVSVAAVAIVLVSGLITGQAGRAKPDIVTIALLLSTGALLLNGARERGEGADRRLPLPPAAIAIAALAAGLTVGTRLNSIPIVLTIGIGLVLLARPGARWLTTLAWFGPMLATCGFWYVRNLFAAGSPLPFVELGIGPISLPATDRIEVYPRDSVADLITDGDVWREWFVPGLEHVFDGLWFVVLAIGLLGMLGAAAARETPVRAVLGAAAAVGVISYLVTPFSATGTDGVPNHFALNLRWAMPALALGLSLFPTLPWLRSSAARPVTAGVVALALMVTFDATRFAEHEYRDTAVLAVALLCLACGATALLLRGARRAPPLEVAAYAGAGLIAVAAAFWPIARDYLDGRYVDVWPGLHVSRSFEWANEVSGARIGLAGTTASFLQYGYYGRDLTNRVEYVGRRGPRGAFAPIETCAEWRKAVNAADLDYLVTSPTLNNSNLQDPGYAPERDWLGSAQAVSPVLEDGPVAVFRVDGRLDPEGCARLERTFSGIPPLLRRQR
jgi:hypothetical protein